MILSTNIAVLLISLGIAADNILLSKMSVNTIPFVKSTKTILLQIVLFTIQLQVLKYGDWFATTVSNSTKNQNKWIALIMLFSIVINMIREFKFKVITNRKTYPELNDFLHIAFATSTYVFVLGFALRLLNIDQLTVYKIVIPCLLFYLLIGWPIKNLNSAKAVRITKILAIVMMFTGITIFLINTI